MRFLRFNDFYIGYCLIAIYGFGYYYPEEPKFGYVSPDFLLYHIFKIVLLLWRTRLSWWLMLVIAIIELPFTYKMGSDFSYEYIFVTTQPFESGIRHLIEHIFSVDCPWRVRYIIYGIGLFVQVCWLIWLLHKPTRQHYFQNTTTFKFTKKIRIYMVLLTFPALVFLRHVWEFEKYMQSKEKFGKSYNATRIEFGRPIIKDNWTSHLDERNIVVWKEPSNFPTKNGRIRKEIVYNFEDIIRETDTYHTDSFCVHISYHYTPPKIRIQTKIEVIGTRIIIENDTAMARRIIATIQD